MDSTRDGVSRDRIVLVAIDALQIDRLAIDQQLPVLDLDFAKADAGGSSLRSSCQIRP